MAIVAIQFIPVQRSNPPIPGDLVAPAPVKNTLRAACYDCHSNRTRWPWYGALAPASWLVVHEVSEGRRRLNFSDWISYTADPATASHKLEEIAEFVSSGKMAPWYYTILHPEARLSPAQRRMIASWARREAGRIAN
jgi:hypothetical protein